MSAIEAQPQEQGSGIGNANAEKSHSAVYAFCLVSAFHNSPLDPEQLAITEGINRGTVGTEDLINLASRHRFKAKQVNLTWEDLERQSFPAIVELKNGQFLVIARVESEQAVLVEPRQGKPLIATRSQLEEIWTGNLVLMRPKIGWSTENPRFGFAWFLPMLKRYRSSLTEVGIAAFVIQIFALATPLFTLLIIDKVLVHRSISTLNVLAGAMLAILLFEAVLGVLRAQLMTRTTYRVDATLGMKVYEHLLSVPLRYFEQRKVGDTVARVKEMETIRQFLTGSSMMAIIDLLFVGVFLLVMFLISYQLTLLVIAMLPLLVGLSVITYPTIRKRMVDRLEKSAEYQSFLTETISSIQTIKSLAAEKQMARRWDSLLASYATASYRSDSLSGIVGSIGQVMQRLITLSILWYGVNLALDGSITAGQLIAFNMIASQVTSPVLRMVQTWQGLQQVGLSIERLGDLMNTPKEPILNTGRQNLKPLQGKVEMEGVEYRYRPDLEPVIKGVSFTIQPGSFVGIVGRSGSGKSTLAKLLQRLYLPSSGKIRFDNIDLNEVDPRWLRRQIGVVPQEGSLFAGTVRENISIHLPDAPMSSVIAAARLAGAEEFIENLPAGYDTPIGERGAILSGGQRQRLAIARALLANPRILIFDEATSALDKAAQRTIEASIQKVRQGRTVFMVAHSLEAIQHADTILVMDNGRIVESGSHRELMERKGMFYNLFQEV